MPRPHFWRVSNPVGSVGDTPLTDLVDAYSQVDGVDWQHQLYSVLTNQPGACAHYRQNQTVADEQWLLVVQIAYRADQQPAPFATGTYQIGVGVTGPDGTLRTVAATYQPHGPSCSQGRQRTRPAARSPTPPSPTPWSRAAMTSSSAATGSRAAFPRLCACSAAPARPRGPAWTNLADTGPGRPSGQRVHLRMGASGCGDTRHLDFLCARVNRLEPWSAVLGREGY
jgi:hypothetical protein